MNISFKDQKMLLANLNGRSELHGEEREPAGDVKLQADVTSEFLNRIAPGLKDLLFCKDENKPADLADAGSDAPNLRFPEMLPPIKWGGEIVGATVSIRAGNKLIELKEARINKLEITPREGGTLTVSVRVQCHPDEKQAGSLYSLIQTEVEVNIAAGETADAPGK